MLEVALAYWFGLQPAEARTLAVLYCAETLQSPRIIARQINGSPKSVKTYISRIREALAEDENSRDAMIAYQNRYNASLYALSDEARRIVGIGLDAALEELSAAVRVKAAKLAA